MAALSNTSTLEVTNAVSQLTVEETRQLVFQMGVQLKTLDDIAAQYDGENRKQHYVQSWLDTDPDASWDKLVAGLRKINKNVLATEIESERQITVARASDTSLPQPTIDPIQPSDPTVEKVKEKIEHLGKDSVSTYRSMDYSSLVEQK